MQDSRPSHVNRVRQAVQVVGHHQQVAGAAFVGHHPVGQQRPGLKAKPLEGRPWAGVTKG